MQRSFQEPCQDSFIVQLPCGLHLRPASFLAKRLSGFQAEITFSCRDQSVSGKSLMGLLSLAAKVGDEVSVEVINLGDGECADAIFALVSDYLCSEEELRS